MPIVTTDLKVYGSLNTLSDGGAIDTSAAKKIGTNGKFNDGAGANVFPDVTGDQAAAGIVLYRKVFLRNEHVTLSLQRPFTWFTAQVNILSADQASIGRGVDDANDNDPVQANLTQLTANAVIAIVSDGVDTRVVTVEGTDTTGAFQSEAITLNGATEVVGLKTFQKIYAAFVTATSATRTVTIKQGSGGATRGTVAPNKVISFIFFQPATKTAGLPSPDIAPNADAGEWLKLNIPAGAPAGAYSFTVKSEGDSAA